MGIWLVIAVLVILSISVFTAGIVVSRQGDAATQERLGQFVGSLSDVDQDDNRTRRAKAGPSALTQSLEQVIEERGLGKNLATDLARADLKITVAEFWALTIISMILVAGLGWLVYGSFVLPLAGLVLGFFLPKIYVRIRQRRRLKAFNDQLGDGITLMANGLRAGYSLLQAMESVSREMPDPMAIEFRRVVQEIGLGVDNERAFNNLLRRVPSTDLDMMVTAINVQQEVGGNLSEILEIIGFVIRERIRIKGEIQVLTAQGQLSGYIISGLPVALGLILFAMNQEYIGRMVFTCESRGIDVEAGELCSQPCGWIMIGIALLGIATGFYAIQRIVDIDV
ncbi:MAG TPA: type II secretion system F family protein [Anaerolineae bacterium]|mgnify:CR=1 FL=1|nr:type II secretion system F family protein [Anaerolineae bacterium]HMR64488.1 type II secretion system F family protein [Anaerolineae bacterium]